MTTKRRAAKLAAHELARDRVAARDDARALALELGRGRPRATFDPMTAGVVLWPGETVYRQVSLWLTVFEHGGWLTPSWASVIVSDQRLLCRFRSGCLASLPWRGMVGLHINLFNEEITLDHGDGQLVILSGPATSTVAVASVAFVYGVEALLQHLALGSLRDPAPDGGIAARRRSQWRGPRKSTVTG